MNESLNGMSVSLITYGFTIVIGYVIAAIIWALPRVINLLDKGHKPHQNG